jgi:molecular chaperone DnaK
VHPDECVALGAALLGDAIDEGETVTLVDALSMPIGYALASGRFRPIIEKNARIPAVKSFRVPPPHRPSADVVEIDVFQGDGETIVQNEYLGTVRLPLSAIGKRLDFRLTEECLLSVEVEEGGAAKEVRLATHDTPELLKKAVADELSRRSQAEEQRVRDEGGMVATLKRFFGGRT